MAASLRCNTDPYAYGNTYSDSNCYAYCDRHRNLHSDRDRYCNPNRNCNCYREPNRNSHGFGHAIANTST